MNESKRLEALRRYRILDTAPDAAFDDVVHLAAQIANVEAVTISFVDTDRVWFKSTYGIQATEMPRSIAFCNITIQGTHVFEIPDTLANPIYADSRVAIHDEKVRFYAGAPLVTPTGDVIGSLCLVRTQPQKLSERQIEALERLSRVIIELLESRMRMQEQAATAEVVQLLNRVAMAANEAVTPEIAIQKCLDEVTRFTGAPIGHYLKVDTTINALVTSGLWSVSDDSRFKNFIEASRTCCFERHQGTVGEVWAEGRALTNPKTLPKNARVQAGVDAGLRSTFAFPVIVKSEVVGVFEFFVEQPVADEDVIMRVASQVGSQIAHTIERQQAEEAHEKQRQFLDAVLDNLSDQVVACGPDGRLSLSNRAFREAYTHAGDQMAPEEYMKRIRLYESDGESEITIRQVPLVRALQGEIVRNVEIVVAHPDGTRIRLITNGRAIFDSKGRKLGALLAMQDITQFKKDQTALLEANAALRAATQAKSQFLANMSHEIRTPLNGVIGMSELLLDSDLSVDQRDHVDIIAKSSQNLLTIISDILDFSKVEAGKMELEYLPFDIAGVLTDVHRVLGHAAKQKNLRFIKEISGQDVGLLKGDAGRIRQVLMNLMNNAIKFTSEGEVHTILRMHRMETGQVFVRIDVRDTGIGINADAMKQLFRAFSQADSSTTRRFGGTGLGLSISKRLVDLMHGDIGVESEEGRGTTFWVTLRLEPAPAEVSPEPLNQLATETDFSGLRVLLAEDNPVNTTIAKKMLAKLGLEAVAVENGKLAVEELKQNQYDLVLMDCQMPEMDGYEASLKIRRDLPGQRNVAIVAMTANAMVGDREKCLAAGMDDYISKPVKLDQLRGAISRAVHRLNWPTTLRSGA